MRKRMEVIEEGGLYFIRLSRKKFLRKWESAYVDNHLPSLYGTWNELRREEGAFPSLGRALRTMIDLEKDKQLLEKLYEW